MGQEFFILRKKIKKTIAENFGNPSDTVLDIGCGSNPYYHSSIKGNILCFDIVKSKITDVVGDADKLDSYFKPNSFDKVISINSLYYFTNPFNVANHVHKILKKDGKFLIVVPFIYPIHDAPSDRYRFTEFGIKTLLEDKFQIEEIITLGGLLSIPALIFHSMLKGVNLFFPKKLRIISRIIIIILQPFYLLAQLFGLLDFLDKTKRFPIYYLVVARKR